MPDLRTGTVASCGRRPAFGFSAHRWSTDALAAAPIATNWWPSPERGSTSTTASTGSGLPPAGPGPIDHGTCDSGPFRFAVGLWPVSPLAIDPGPAARELAEMLVRAGEEGRSSVFEPARPGASADRVQAATR